MRAHMQILILCIVFAALLVDVFGIPYSFRSTRLRAGLEYRLYVLDSRSTDTLQREISVALNSNPKVDAVMLYWNPQDRSGKSSVRAVVQGESIGHVALAFKEPSVSADLRPQTAASRIPKTFAYLSWWPDTGDSPGFTKADLNAVARSNTPDADTGSEGHLPAAMYLFSGLNLTAMKRKYIQFLDGGHGRYVFRSRNCGQVASAVLNEGNGDFSPQPDPKHFGVLAPYDVYKLMKEKGQCYRDNILGTCPSRK